MSIPVRLSILILCGCMFFAAGCSDITTDTDISASTNTAPTINSVTASPNTVAKGKTSRITVYAVDPENDDLTYTFDANGGTLDASGNYATWEAPSVPGKYTVNITISDGRNTTTGWVALTVYIPVTTLTGSLVLPPGETGELTNARVSLKAGTMDSNSDILTRYANVQTNGSTASFIFEDVTPGHYWLEAWRDTDHDGLLSTGDLFGQFGNTAFPANELPPLELAEGQTRFVQIQMGAFNVISDEDITTGGTGDDDSNFKGDGDITSVDVDK